PGGPELAKLACQGDPKAFALPRPMLHSKDLNFSFSGLKTAVFTQQQKLEAHAPMSLQQRSDLAASIQAAIVEVLIKKCLVALKQTGLQHLVVAGGVGANQELRAQLNHECGQRHIQVHYPELSLCTDNGAMIALAAGMRVQAGIETPVYDYSFAVRPRWSLELQ
ncbi:MAG: carbamoyltransferase N-terminal domain-containing protein, partial [Saezia sp.]